MHRLLLQSYNKNVRAKECKCDFPRIKYYVIVFLLQPDWGLAIDFRKLNVCSFLVSFLIMVTVTNNIFFHL